MIETYQRQHDKILKSILAALGSSADGSLEPPEGITLPAKTLQELLNIEKKIEDGENFQTMVSTRQHDICNKFKVLSCNVTLCYNICHCLFSVLFYTLLSPKWSKLCRENGADYYCHVSLFNVKLSQ